MCRLILIGCSLTRMFGTSKDITIGPVAVMSSLMGEIVRQAAITSPSVPGHIVASSLALISGCIIFALGLLRLGFVVDFVRRFFHRVFWLKRSPVLISSDLTSDNRGLFDELGYQYHRRTGPNNAWYLSPIRYSCSDLSNHN